MNEERPILDYEPHRDPPPLKYERAMFGRFRSGFSVFRFTGDILLYGGAMLVLAWLLGAL